MPGPPGGATAANGFAGSSGTTTLAFSDLDFGGGHVLTGFDLSYGHFDLTTTVGPNSLLFSFPDGPYTRPDDGVLISGTFLTAPAVIPLPAAAWLLLGALWMPGAIGRRKG